MLPPSDAGVRKSAGHLDAYTPKDECAAIIAAVRSGEARTLSSANVLGIGFDFSEASCGVLAHPALSGMLDTQQKGRLIRPAPGKTDFAR